MSRLNRLPRNAISDRRVDPRVAQHPRDDVAQLASRTRRSATGAAIATATLAALGATVALGCAKSPAARADAGVDAGPEVPARPCTLNTICAPDLKSVLRCEADGTAGATIDTCGPTATCSLGRCTTSDCATAENESTATGCLFYGTAVADIACDTCETCYQCQPTSILVTNPGPRPATVALQTRAAGQQWAAIQTITVDAGGSGNFTPPNRQFTDAGKVASQAYRLFSDARVVVLVVQGDDSNEATISSAGTQLLPVQGLGIDYLAVTYPQVDTAKLDATPGSRGGAGAITIVATQDRTKVTFVAARAASTVVDLGGGVVLNSGDAVPLMLDDGDVYQIFSAAGGADLSGSEISADKPIAVFSGNVSTTYGRSVDGVNTPDAASEELLPISEWSHDYVAAWLPPQTDVCDTLFESTGSALWRIVASHADTKVTFMPSGPTEGLPASDPMLERGQVVDFFVRGGASVAVHANWPIAIMQGMDCEPTLSSAVPTEALMTDLMFALPVAFDHELAVVRSEGLTASNTPRTITLDGAAIAEDMFHSAGGGFQVAQVPIPPCYTGSEPDVPASCQHHLHGQFGVTLRGMDGIAGYALTAMTWKPCFDTGCIP